MTKKQIGLKLSAITLAVLLAGCGGGGSDGYYNSDSSNNGSTGNGSDTGNGQENTVISEKYFLEIQSSKPTVDVTGDEVDVTLRLVDENGGGVKEKSLSLILDQAVRDKGLSNNGASVKITDENGYASFKLSFKPSVSVDLINDLLANGLNISASYTDENNSKAIQNLNIRVINNGSDATTPAYNLTMKSNKQLLSVKGGDAIITVQAVDNDGAIASAKDVVLKILNPTGSGAIILNSKAVTDTVGIASFNISIQNGLTASQQAALIDQGIILQASIIDANGNETLQNLVVRVTNSEGTEATPNLSFGRTAKLASVNSDLDYEETMSVRVVDKDGNAIDNEDFTIELSVVDKKSGHYVLGKNYKASFEIDKKNISDDITDLKTNQTDLTARKSVLSAKDPASLTVAESTELTSINKSLADLLSQIKEKENKLLGLNNYSIASRYQFACIAQQNLMDIATAINGDAIQTISGNRYTATTDKSGQFKFNISYFKTYATWQTVRINIKSATNNFPNLNVSYDYPLSLLQSDFDAETVQPFDMSPYNTNSTQSPCSESKPWANLL
ncbi:hypothetical protein [Acinetobacter pragensis]|uniref:Cadherin domain-containing protein n=1 Tax=Acinetobacter pragensis TaxID=1806892 RepID=A0A151Y0L1_9GAMM|nr:hypothetical protein [Acinetobacter pragensis]KYQ71534.1 hypothetical protein AZH43_13640 [Acinetobacter pragensis]